MAEIFQAAMAELADAEARFRMVADAPAEVRSVLGTECVRVGGGVAVSWRNDVTQLGSRALGLGFEERSPRD